MLAGLRLDQPQHIRDGHALHRVEGPEAAGVKGRLDGDSEHRRVIEAEVDDLPDFMFVDAALEGHHQHGVQSGLGQPVERAQFVFHQPSFAPNDLVRPLVEAVELQIDPGLEFGQPRQETVVAGNPYAVGVEHDVLDVFRQRELDEIEDARVDRRLAAGELHDLRVALGGDEPIQHVVHLLVSEFITVRRVACAGLVSVSEAQRAGQVAGGVDFNQSETGVLSVLRTQAAVVGAALGDLGGKLQRECARLIVAGRRDVQRSVVEHERLEPAVLRAALAHDHPVVAE